MSRELEQRLERVLGQVESSATSEEQAREAALSSLGAGSARGPYRLALAAAVVAVALVTAGVTLAASGTARDAVGLSGKALGPAPATPVAQGPLPAGAAGFATVSGQRVWLARPHSTNAVRARFAAFELSPNAIYAAAGRRGALLALDPADMSVVARHAVHGTVTAISWAPIGIHIVYVVRDRGRFALHLIDGDLTNDRVVATGVANVQPAWRWDSLAFAYALQGGGVRVDDLWRGRIVTVAAPEPAGGGAVPDQLAFAPHGDQLAVSDAGASSLWIGDSSGAQRPFRLPLVPVIGPVAQSGGFAWVSRHDLVETTDQFLQRVHVAARRGIVVARATGGSAISGVAVSPDGRSLALAMRGRQVLVTAIPAALPERRALVEHARLAARQVLLTFGRAPQGRVTLIWR